MLLRVVKLVMDRYMDIVDTLYDAEGFFWSAKQADTRYCTLIAPQNIYGLQWITEVNFVACVFCLKNVTSPSLN